MSGRQRRERWLVERDGTMHVQELELGGRTPAVTDTVTMEVAGRGPVDFSFVGADGDVDLYEEVD